MGSLGTMTSLKYEVDESYWLIDGNAKLTPQQKEKMIRELDKKRRQLRFQANALVVCAVVTFLMATGLIIYRRKIIDKKGI